MEKKSFERLVSIVDTLLGPEGCPWDKAQTHKSLKHHLIEEAYEVAEAIDAERPELLKEELGDLLLQVVMHAQMDAQKGFYDIYDVVETISEKLVRRHPHVFGEARLANAEQVLERWDEIKKEEKEGMESILEGVPKSMPALMRAQEIGKRASRAGFDWNNREGVIEKIHEEEKELMEAIEGGDKSRMEHELGDLLFAVVNLARWLDIDSEEALSQMVNRFTERFKAMEKKAKKPLRELTFEEWDELWESTK
ncbi:MAG TPA: nucleoside triphosphate pyrophosphohydrolase [Fimbriimonadales bacterium]|nr:nucleoside triphosphate pyrophosphohydrolase [Fimbriimonadales bacterium]